MKRLIAKRKLRRACDYCGRKFRKGDTYYRLRDIGTEFDEVAQKTYVMAHTFYMCPKCRYKGEQHKIRERKRNGGEKHG